MGHLYLRRPWLYFHYENVATIWRAERLRSARRDWKDGGDVLDSTDAGFLQGGMSGRSDVACCSAASSPGCCHPPVSPCLWDTLLLGFFCHFYHQGKAPIFTENLICRKNIKKKNHQVLSASLESLPSLRERSQSAASLPRIRPHGRLTAGFFFTKKGLGTAWTTSGSALRHSLPRPPSMETFGCAPPTVRAIRFC